jgi:hypothetical protein
MKPEIKTKWLAALRNGVYKQGKNKLRTSDAGTHRYCCLGVLCDLHAKETNQKWTDANDYLGCYHALPAEVCTWAELPLPDDNDHIGDDIQAYNPFINLSPTNMRSLSGLNDSGHSFNDIATAIEEDSKL